MAGRRVLITGGTRGIGEAISKEFAKEGYKIVANYGKNHQAAEKFTLETGIKSLSFNVGDYEECQAGVKQAEEILGGNIEILINNAGITKDGFLHKMPVENFESVLKTNLFSCFYLSQLTVPQMRQNKFGRIINLSSINALAGQLGQTNYSASKAGILGFTKALAQEGAGKNITVNAITPGYIETDMTKDIDDKILETIRSKIPAGRLGKPEEIARTALFLAADGASFITGETISVNGGQYMK